MIITSQTGGRLANQLYFLLQAYCISNRKGIDCKYTQINSFAKQTMLQQYVDQLNISEYFVDCKKPDVFLKLNNYYQEIDVDFSEAELNQFIRQTILKSEFFNVRSITSNLETTAAIHIRNGDYLDLPYHNCFDRKQYLNNALSILSSCITTVDIYSDDNVLNKELYEETFKLHNVKTNYVISNDPIYDLKELSFYKYKILWNSTFSYWSAFIAECRYKNIGIKNMTICPIKFSAVENAITRCKKEWILI